MVTKKQTEANRRNAQLSTGAVTEAGKSIVSRNAVRHGIFTRDLVITTGDGKEDVKEYQEVLENLIASLNPSGQMESLLVEKISVDFWRLKRVIRFETGSIRNYLDMALYQFYKDDDNKTDDKANKEISDLEGYIEWESEYIKCLENGLVQFDKPEWKHKDLESHIEEDLDIVIDKNKYDLLDESERELFENGEMALEQKQKLLRENGFDDKKLNEILAPCFEERVAGYKKQIAELETEKIRTRCHAEINLHKLSLPGTEDSEKVMRYERSLQKSIMQNLLLLKRLQAERGVPPAEQGEDWYSRTV